MTQCRFSSLNQCSFRGQLEEWFHQLLPSTVNLIFRDLSMGGITTEYAMYCTRFQGDEDLVFMEYEPNGGWIDGYLEGLRRQLPSSAAVVHILLPPNINRTLPRESLSGALHYSKVDLAVNVDSAFRSEACESLTRGCWVSYFANRINHPSALGHAAIAYFIAYAIEARIPHACPGSTKLPPLIHRNLQHLPSYLCVGPTQRQVSANLSTWTVTVSQPHCCGRTDHKVSWRSPQTEQATASFVLPLGTVLVSGYFSSGSYGFGTVISSQGKSMDLCIPPPFSVPKGKAFNRIVPLAEFSPGFVKPTLRLANLKSRNPNCSSLVNMIALLIVTQHNQ